MHELPAAGLKHATAFIDRNALLANLAHARSKAPAAATLAMVKANAYGHGMFSVAEWLADGCEYLGVARLREAQALREHGIQHRIVVFGHRFNASEIALAAKLHLTPCLYSAHSLADDSAQCERHKLRYWLKLDTGMHRLGIPHAAGKIINAALASPLCEVALTHLHSADAQDLETAAQQLQRFGNALGDANYDIARRRISVANSALLMQASQPAQYEKIMRNALPDYNTALDIIRPGIMLYGANPLAHSPVAQTALQPVMTFAAPVIDVKPVAIGESVGYGATWRASKPAHIATVAAGYGDGYPRHASNDTPVMINGQRCPLAGRVSMDSIGVDVSELYAAGKQVQPGDSALLWGPSLRVEDIAGHAGTISYQLTTGVSDRVERVIL